MSLTRFLDPETALLPYKKIAQLSLPFEKPAFSTGDIVGEKKSRNALGIVVEFEIDHDEKRTLLAKIKTVKKVAEGLGYHFPWHQDWWKYDEDEKYAFLFLPLEEICVLDFLPVSYLANILYPNYFHSCYEMRDVSHFLQNKNPICWHERCNNLSYGVGIINCWGTVMPVVMCEEHARLHGWCMEISPFSQKNNTHKIKPL